MQNFLRSLFTNRFGLTLAIANLALIAFSRSGIFSLLGLENSEAMVFLVNMPARLVSMIFTSLFIGRVTSRFSDVDFFTLDMLIFVFLQWLFVGWLAQAISKAIRGRVVSCEL
jgi:hypothetical protein